MNIDDDIIETIRIDELIERVENFVKEKSLPPNAVQHILQMIVTASSPPPDSFYETVMGPRGPMRVASRITANNLAYDLNLINETLCKIELGANGN